MIEPAPRLAEPGAVPAEQAPPGSKPVTPGSVAPPLASDAPDAAAPDRAAPPRPLACSAVLTHHWLTRFRGGERVLEALGDLLPDAPIYTLVYDPAGFSPGQFPRAARSGRAARAIHTSFLQRLPAARSRYQNYLPLMPLAARTLRLPEADLVVCSDAALAKAMRPHPRSVVVCYCHSPMRYVYEPPVREEYRRALAWPLRPLWSPTLALVRRADQRAARRVDRFVANSRHVAARVERAYGRPAEVVYPPVDLPPAPPAWPRESFYLAVGYHVPYKRLDLAVEACRRLGRRLVVIGDGPDVRRIEQQRRRDSQAHLHVTLLGWQDAAVIRDHYARAAALLFPGEEDFGIVPVEAMAHGCPVIAYGVGGATESVIPNETGVLFDRQQPDSLIAAMNRCETLRFDPHRMHAAMLRFSRAAFLQSMASILQAALAQKR